MIIFIVYTFIIAMASCWVILFMTKVGFREYMQVHAPEILSKLFSCDFCLSWWVCLFLSIIASIAAGTPYILLCSFCATPLTRHYLV